MNTIFFNESESIGLLLSPPLRMHNECGELFKMASDQHNHDCKIKYSTSDQAQNTSTTSPLRQSANITIL